MNGTNRTLGCARAGLAVMLALAGCARSHELSPTDGGVADAPVDLAPVDLAPVDLAPVDLAPVDLAPPDLAPADAGPPSPCWDSEIYPEAFSLSGSEPAPEGLVFTQACVTATGLGDCHDVFLELELLDAGGARVGFLFVHFEDLERTSAERECRLGLTAALDPPVACSFVGFFDSSGRACGGTEPWGWRACGELRVEQDGRVFEGSVALDVGRYNICF